MRAPDLKGLWGLRHLALAPAVMRSAGPFLARSHGQRRTMIAPVTGPTKTGGPEVIVIERVQVGLIEAIQDLITSFELYPSDCLLLSLHLRLHNTAASFVTFFHSLGQEQRSRRLGAVAFACRFHLIVASGRRRRGGQRPLTRAV